MSTPMAAVATNGTNNQQMRGKPSADTKGVKSFSEELASAQDACPPASQGISTSDLIKCPKSSPRARTTNVTNLERSSVRSKGRENRRDEISTHTQTSPALTPDKARELEPATIAMQIAPEQVPPHALTTRTVTPQGASSFPKKVDAVARGNQSSIGTAAAPEGSATPQLRAKASVPNQATTKSEDHPARLERIARAKAASPSADSRPSEGSVAPVDAAPAEDGVVTMQSAPIAAADAPTESESIQIIASFDAKNIVSIPVVTSKFSSETTLRTGSTQAKRSGQDSVSFDNAMPRTEVLRVEDLEGGKDKTVAAKSEPPTTDLPNATSSVSRKIPDQPHSQLVDHVQSVVPSDRDSKRDQEIHQFPNAGRDSTTRPNVAVPSGIPALSRGDTPQANLRAYPEKDVRVERPDSPNTSETISVSFIKGSRGASKSAHSVTAQQISSVASEIRAVMADAQDPSATSVPDKTADASANSLMASPVLASVTPMSTTSEGPDTNHSATMLDAAAQLEQIRQLAAAHSFLQTAKLTDRGGRTELHVGLTAGELGNVSIRTFMVRDQVKAEISVQKEELRNLLAVGLFEIQNKMSGTADTAPNIVFSTGADQRQGSNGSAQTFQDEQGSFPRSGANAIGGEIVSGGAAPLEASSTSAKLDIRM